MCEAIGTIELDSLAADHWMQPKPLGQDVHHRQEELWFHPQGAELSNARAHGDTVICEVLRRWISWSQCRHIQSWPIQMPSPS